MENRLFDFNYFSLKLMQLAAQQLQVRGITSTWTFKIVTNTIELKSNQNFQILLEIVGIQN